jgi:hypothetical protein
METLKNTNITVMSDLKYKGFIRRDRIFYFIKSAKDYIDGKE